MNLKASRTNLSNFKHVEITCITYNLYTCILFAIQSNHFNFNVNESFMNKKDIEICFLNKTENLEDGGRGPWRVGEAI